MSLPKHGLVLVALAAFCNPGALVAQSTTTAFFVSQRTTGNTIQCTYDGLGSRYIRTIQSYEICPLSIQVRTGG